MNVGRVGGQDEGAVGKASGTGGTRSLPPTSCSQQQSLPFSPALFGLLASMMSPASIPPPAHPHLLAELQQRLHQKLQHAAAAQHRGAVNQRVAHRHPAGEMA